MIKYDSLRLSNINRWKRMYVFEFTNDLMLLDKCFFCDNDNKPIKHKSSFENSKAFERLIYES